MRVDEELLAMLVNEGWAVQQSEDWYWDVAGEQYLSLLTRMLVEDICDGISSAYKEAAESIGICITEETELKLKNGDSIAQAAWVDSIRSALLAKKGKNNE